MDESVAGSHDKPMVRVSAKTYHAEAVGQISLARKRRIASVNLIIRCAKKRWPQNAVAYTSCILVKPPPPPLTHSKISGSAAKLTRFQQWIHKPS